MTTLFIPMALALAGIVLRGATFAFRKYAATLSQARLFGAVFAGSSLISPFFLGTVAGAIASARVPAQGYGDRLGFVAQSDLAGRRLPGRSALRVSRRGIPDRRRVPPS